MTYNLPYMARLWYIAHSIKYWLACPYCTLYNVVYMVLYDIALTSAAYYGTSIITSARPTCVTPRQITIDMFSYWWLALVLLHFYLDPITFKMPPNSARL